MAQPLTLFYNNGKTFVGGVVDSTTASTVNKNIATTDNNNYYVISSPCEVELELTESEGSTSRIKFKRIMPLCPIKISTKDGEKNKVLFAFEKSSTYLSNVTSDSLHPDLIDAYKKMTGVTTII